MISKSLLKTLIGQYLSQSQHEIDEDELSTYLFEEVCSRWVSEDKMLPVRLLAAVQVLQDSLELGVAGSEVCCRMLGEGVSRCSLWTRESQVKPDSAATGMSQHHSLAEGLVELAKVLLEKK